MWQIDLSFRHMNEPQTGSCNISVSIYFFGQMSFGIWPIVIFGRLTFGQLSFWADLRLAIWHFWQIYVRPIVIWQIELWPIVISLIHLNQNLAFKL
jgi:hypothetical protein